MRLPEELVVEVRSAEDGRPVEGAEVWLITVALGRPHLRVLMGLTDRRGAVRTGRARLLAAHQAAQAGAAAGAGFGLEEGDEGVLIEAQGGEPFAIAEEELAAPALRVELRIAIGTPPRR